MHLAFYQPGPGVKRLSLSTKSREKKFKKSAIEQCFIKYYYIMLIRL